MYTNGSKPLSRRENIVVQEYGNEILIYDLTIDKAYCLNNTSALVWQACDGSRTIGEISSHIGKKLKSPVSEDFVWLALEQLEKENLLVKTPAAENPLAGLSRREAIRRVGLASLVALPVIASLIAPTAAHAQSGGGCFGNNNLNQSAAGCTCDSASDCISNCCGRAEDLSVICVAVGGDSNGSVCRAACECSSNCCGIGFTCAAFRAKATGEACRVNCECISNSCTGANTCA